jgi:hypothetical protein
MLRNFGFSSQIRNAEKKLLRNAWIGLWQRQCAYDEYTVYVHTKANELGTAVFLVHSRLTVLKIYAEL